MLTSASYAKDAFEFFAMVQSYTIILNNVPLHDDIWLTDLRGLSTDKICRAIIEKEYNEIVAKNIATRKSAGNYNYTLSKVIKPANKSIRYGKTIELQSDGLFSKYFYEDNVLSILIYGGEKQFEFLLTNKTKNSIKVVWNEASIVDQNNLVSKVVHKGVRYMDANNPQPPTTILSGATLSELVAPTNRIKYSDGWYQQSIIASNRSNDINVVGKTIKVLLPIEIAGVVNEYVFCFTIGWNFTYPEYQD